MEDHVQVAVRGTPCDHVNVKVPVHILVRVLYNGVCIITCTSLLLICMYLGHVST